MRLSRLLRNRAIGLTRRALAPLAGWQAARAPATLPLDVVRRRLELLLAAMYGRPLRIGAASSRPRDVAGPAPDILLPPLLDARAGMPEATERYRLLAIEQAERVARGSNAAGLPGDRLERDLFLIAEGAAVDRAIADRAPGLTGALAAVRRRELSTRPPAHRLSGAEREVETLLQGLLAREPGDHEGEVPRPSSPDGSLAWARAEAAVLRARFAAAARYSGIRPVALWGTEATTARDTDQGEAGRPPLMGDQRTASTATARSSGRHADSRKAGEAQGAPSAEGTGAATDAPRAAEGPPLEGAREPAGPATARAEERDAGAAPGGIRYREWDEYAGRYRADEVTVRDDVAAEVDDAWAVTTLRAHAPLVRQIRARFAPLRAHRERLRAQPSGDELDLDACVAALVEMRRGRVPSDRLYRLTTPARRSLAIMLLVDVSGSTSAPVADGRSVLDVERMTLLLASEALDELGEPYAALAFSSSGRHDVQVQTLKAFADRDPAAVRRRVSALTSARTTRLGAALRHATALLNAQPAERRLLLLLSDGQPNDVGGYQGSYAVADSRQAVLEARACGVHPFCLTVEREEHEYLPHLFGTNGYRILREPGQLPAALLEVVRRMIPA